ncbi:2-phosphosulfolactate phosphatase [Inquilinus limosus]|uniref:Probable 2-phosphosulfolactate phosphatase n=1 Tax=Inquilinus limosus TaxID=171674 RepID=A0A211YWL1_9PROT|nr:2-phosphosulfolactate phosphatase [Inquilinus limosus]OWJ57420.1 2-phosphosulfolactate phosphatase [Inquilinus limosus]
MAQVLAEWGMAGIEALRDRVAALVVVDVLSFCTAVDVAVSRSAQILPFPYGDPAAAKLAAERAGALLARPRRAAGGQLSLSPASLLGIPAGTRLMLPSPNGSRLSLAGGGTPVLAGCLRNAAAVARAARGLAGDGAIGVIPAGERWPDGGLRPAIEDLIGAGAVIDALDLPCSPEAQVMRDACRTAGADIPQLIRESVSGRELTEGGFPRDVALALEREVSATAPLLAEGVYRAG